MIEFETPAGIGIRYQPESEGKRQYWIRAEAVRPYAEGGYPTEWREVPSVSEALGILDKPQLPWWGMQMGVDGVRTLIERRIIVPVEVVEGRWVLTDGTSTLTRDEIVALLQEHKLTTNDVRDRAGERGTAAHAALEAWAMTGARAEPAGYPDEQAGYVEAVLKFCADAQLSNARAEVMVGSLAHGYAGRYDLRGELSGDLVVNLRGKDGTRQTFDEQPTLLDLKTSKYVTANHFLQMEAYEGAGVECGYEPTMRRVVIHARADGRYVVKTNAKWTHSDFLAVLGAWRTLKRKGYR
jgi:hypothetical protein